MKKRSREESKASFRSDSRSTIDSRLFHDPKISSMLWLCSFDNLTRPYELDDVISPSWFRVFQYQSVQFDNIRENISFSKRLSQTIIQSTTSSMIIEYYLNTVFFY